MCLVSMCLRMLKVFAGTGWSQMGHGGVGMGAAGGKEGRVGEKEEVEAEGPEDIPDMIVRSFVRSVSQSVSRRRLD